MSKGLQISVLLVLMTCSFSSLVRAETRVSEAEAKKNIISKVEPAFPPIARQLNLSGKVEVDLYVDETGEVEKVDAISGNPILAGAAVNASKHWKFQPFQTDGKPSKAVVRIAFNFVR
ncbi:MAG: energy transducer TonB [Bryobacteraceae bacterium]